MTTKHHAGVWLDHHEARLFYVDADGSSEMTLHAPTRHVHRHPKDGLTAERHHPDDAHHFFRAVARELDAAERVLVVGPSIAKLQFLRYVDKHEPNLAARIVGIETLDHPSDRQLIAHAKHYFGVDPPRYGLAQGAQADAEE